MTSAVIANATLAQQALAEQVTPVVAAEEIAYRESELGIDYRAIADAPVDAMLSQGEAEWMANASKEFGDEAAEIWAQDMAVEIGSGRISEFTEKDMREFTPNMLLAFSTIDPNHPKYLLLASVGDRFQLDQHLGTDG